LAGASRPAETVDHLNEFFFRKHKFQVTNDLTTSAHLLPAEVIENRKGYCVGLGAVYLILAEELNLPIHAVATPKHVFLRWDDGSYRRNIELFEEGRDVPDGDYIRDEKIPDQSIKVGVFLRNLTDKEFIGLVYQNLGVLESQRRNFEQSGNYYAKALRLNHKLAAAYHNRGNDELVQKNYRKAIRDYDKALELYPENVWTLQNRGLAWKGLGKMEKAQLDWKLLREIEPGFIVAK
jgi:tetratricopeptide (TPR) repeat protein